MQMQVQVILIGVAAALLAALGIFIVVESQPSPSEMVTGDVSALGIGLVRTWESWDNGELHAVGVTIDEGVLLSLPEEVVQLALEFPRSYFSSPFKHVLFDWNPQGHEPPGIYDLPHFDIHFYMTSIEERQAIQAGHDEVGVLPEYAPQDYFSIEESIPQMGVHWIDQDAKEFNGQVFDETLIYGYYRGKLIFMEPMITKAFFQSHTDLTVDIKQPNAFQRTGMYYPTQYRVDYDARAKAYNVILDGMVMR